VDGTNQLPLYEYLNLSVQDIGKDTISFQFGGWFRYELKDTESDHRTNNDLSYAYLSYRSKSANTIVNVGRVMVFEGVASDRVDGVYAKTDLRNNFGISAFGGSPAETGTDLPGNKNIYGTRLSHQIPGLYQIGISYVREEKDSAVFREEEGADLWLKPAGKVELLGKSRYNAMTKAWSEHTYFLSLGPFEKVRLNTEASKVNYKDYFTGMTTKAFDFTKSSIDPKDKVTILGEEAAYSATDRLTVGVNYKAYAYEIAGNAKNYGGSIKYVVVGTGGAGFVINKMAGATDKLKYAQYRVYGFRKFGHSDVTVDVMKVAYVAAVNGVKDAYSSTLAASYELTERIKLGADLEYSKTPDFDKEVRTLIKLTYSFDTAKTAHKAPEQGTSVAPPAQTAPQAGAEQTTPATAPDQGKRKEGAE